MKRALSLTLSLLLTAGILAGCGGAKTAPAAETQKVKVTVIPTQASDKFKEQMNKLGTLLSKESGLDVEIRIPTDYAAAVEDMRFGKTDVAYFGPFTYVVANAQSGAKAFVTQNIKGKPFYHSYAIVQKESPIKELDDKSIATLKGKTIALGDPGSTSSSQIPQLAMKNAGLDRQKDVQLVFTGAHDAVLKTVAAGKADIGFVDSAIFEGSLSQKFPDDYAKVRVVWKSMELYQYPWAHRKDLDPAVVKKLQDAFLKVTDKDALEPFGADAFIVTDDAKYDPVREAAKALEIDLKNYQVK
ncbi:MAG: phosphonate transporter substrate-binding protein [Symbiobacteriaceae bacterium]|jgi:phosphonate transport system substrate-binding protein|nr:phosphonate transporter substrate-binding protein [Symbiobacteriaceae bacterium]